jgi:predicted metalloprotease
MPVQELPPLFVGLTDQSGSQQSELVVESAEEQELVDFVSLVLADTEETWHTLFQQQGDTYQEPRLVLFHGAVNSACGLGQAAIGPFYCPGDHKVSIDLSFYSDLKHRFKAPGDFAQAYVIAHEVGHHVQRCSAFLKRYSRARDNSVRRTATRYRYTWNCRPIVSPACGRTTPISHVSY